MQPTFCQSFFAFLLKFLNYVQSFVGVLIVLYSVWMLNHWYQQVLNNLPAPWFIFTVMAVGIFLCLIAFMGYIVAGASNGFCLSFYAVFTSILILVEAALVADLVFNRHREEDLPHDATGELKRLCAFIEANIDIFKWVAVTVVVVQALSLLLAIILRGVVPPRRVDYESDEDFTDVRKPLVYPKGGPASASTSVDSTGIHSDTWTSRMRQKYGLVPNPLSNDATDPKASVSTTGHSCDDRKQCSIL